ncbi:MAG: response regulator [Desulfobacterales bacterium]|nr:response regulator [Desulfobacterales bacterium]
MADRIVIADDETITRMDLREILTLAGYQVVGEAGDGLAAVELCRRTRPDMAILDVKMPSMDGIRVARVLREEKLVPAVLMMTAHSEKGVVDQAGEAGVLGYVVKPIREESLLPMVAVTLAKGRELEALEAEISAGKGRIRDRARLEKAKGILMDRLGLSEEEAFQALRKRAMDMGASLGEVAARILDGEWTD